MKITDTLLWGLLLMSASAWSQDTSKTPAAPQVQQQVVVNGSQTDIEASRDFVAGKLIIGRKQIADSGLQNVSEILKREPAVSVGKDGRLGLLGLPGYTQILIDGQAPTGKSPLELDLSQVDKIEIIKSATAETGPFGIAGTINIISRKVERKNVQQLRMGATAVTGEYGANASWNLNQFSPDSPLSLSLNTMAKHERSPSASHAEQVQTTPTLQPQFESVRKNLRTTEFLTLSSELAYKLDANNNLSFRPDIGRITLSNDRSEQRYWSNGRQQQALQRGTSPMTSYSLPLTWSYDAGDSGQLETIFRFNQMQIKNDSWRSDEDTSTDYAVRRQAYRTDQSSYFLSLNYKTSFSGGHDFKTGLQLTHGNQDIKNTYWLNNLPDTSLSLLGGNINTGQKTRRLFVQDDWRVNKNLALNAGLSVEDRVLKINEYNINSNASFTVWSPSLHFSKKLEGDQKRRWRASLAQSFRAPELDQLMLQPSVNAFAPCTITSGCGQNTIDTPDSMGNPALQPERAIAMNLAYEHGLTSDSQITVELYARQIARKTGTEVLLMNVPWANQARYVERPANLGHAELQGINVDWRVAARDLWKTTAKLDLRGSLGWAHSVLSDLSGPNNRLEGQSPWRAKFGMTYTMADLPVKIDLDANWLPGDWYRNNLTQRTYEARKTTLTANANWTVNPSLRLVMNLDNLFAPQAESISEYRGNSNTLQTHSFNSSYTRVGIRMELKL